MQEGFNRIQIQVCEPKTCRVLILHLCGVSQRCGYLWKYDILFIHFYPILLHSVFCPPHFLCNYLLWLAVTQCVCDIGTGTLGSLWLPDTSDRCVLAFRESPSVFTILTDCVWLFPGHLQTRLVHCGGARWTHQRSAEGKSQSASCSTNTGSVWSYLDVL